jgi:hypothetical protein
MASVFFRTERYEKDLNQGQGKESPLSVFSSPLSDLQSQGQLPRERKEMSMYSLTQLKQTTPVFLIVLVFACFAFAPQMQAVVPPPDGGYPNFNTAEGTKALQSLTTGAANTAVGWLSLFSNAEGDFNTATGAGSLLFNTADENTAFGAAALLFNTTGLNNTAVGAAALLNNIDGGHNNAVGVNALRDNTAGNFNNAHGRGALGANVDGDQNNAFGDFALANVVSGNFNTAIGDDALVSNISGDSNTAIGHAALVANTDSENTAIGGHALESNTAGSGNVAVGFEALARNTTGSTNTAIGLRALFNSTTGNLNAALGFAAGFGLTTASNTICIGTTGANVSNACFIGNIFGVGINDAVPVLIDSNDQLGTNSSSRRFKKEIKPMEKASEAVLALKPVTFRYKTAKRDTPQFGLIAEEVAEVNPDLVVRDKNGEIYSVRYDAVNAMLLNEFLKEHQKVAQQQIKIEKQQATIADVKSTLAQQQENFQSKFAHQQKQIEVLTAGLQKVSAQLELSKAAPQTVLNNQ